MSARDIVRKLYALVTDDEDGAAAREWRAEDCCPCECARPKMGLRDPSARPRIYVR